MNPQSKPFKHVCVFLNGQQHLDDFQFKIRDHDLTPYLKAPQGSQPLECYLADGGLNYFLECHPEHQINTLFWAGDADSLSQKSHAFLSQNPQIQITAPLQVAKDFSDFAFLLDFIQHKYPDTILVIEIYGGLGHRRDHELTNIFEALHFLSQRDAGCFIYFHGGQILSSLPFACETIPYFGFSIPQSHGPVHIQGALYSGRHLLHRPSYGLSNEILKKEFSIDFYSEKKENTKASQGKVNPYVMVSFYNRS